VTALAPERVVVVVLNWRRADDTIGCVRSLGEAGIDAGRILVVDNGSGDGSTDAIRSACPGIGLLELPDNRGFAGGNNAGIRRALGGGADAVLVLNNDTRVAPDFLRPLLAVFADSPEAGAVCAAVFRQDRPEMLDVAWSEVRFAERHAVNIRGVNALPAEGFDRRTEVEVAIGCCVLLRAETLRAVGLFDETYFAYHEDVDWCLRARRAGWRLFFEPYARVFHRGSGSTTGLRARPAAAAAEAAHPDLPNAEPLPWNPVRTYLGSRNLVRLLRRHANRKDQLRFARACMRELPLELMALVLGRAGWLRLGRFGWRDVARWYVVERRPLPRTPLLRAMVMAGRVPLALVVVPRDVVHARREGLLDELHEYCRGLVDGVWDRPLPLVRLGLAPARGERAG
jgi:GT2 family glycosyltransferase